MISRESLQQLIMLAGTTLLIWFSVGVVTIATGNTEIQNVAIILAFLTTLTFGLIAGLNQIESLKVSGNASPQEKAKRDAAAAHDARMDLLLSLLNEGEREALKERLIGDVTGDGEALTLAELLAAQEDPHDHQTRM